MNKKLIYTALFLAGISILFAFGVFYTKQQDNTALRGNLLFADTEKQSLEVNKIIIKASQYTVTLILEDGFWRIKEKGNYYANLTFVNEFLNFLNEARIFNVFKEKTAVKNDENDTLVETYAQNGTKLDAVVIGQIQGEYQSAGYAGENKRWLITQKFIFPQQSHSWLLEPLVDVNINRVNSLKVISDKGMRSVQRTPNTPYFYSANGRLVEIKPLLSQFIYLTFTDALSSSAFNKQAAEQGNQYQITMDNGLIYNIFLYKKDEKYYANLNLSSTHLPTTETSNYIKDNAFLYDDWFFQISPQKGKFLFNH